MHKHRYLTVLFLLIITSYALLAQTRYPIYVHPVLTPPYSLRISDYGQAGSTRLVIHVNVNDFTVTNLPVRLHIKMENLSGGSIETHPNAAVMPIYLNGGEVRIFFGEDLAPYFNIDNLVFSGYSKEQYRRTGQLQEGFYRITVHVRHFLTGRIISNEGPAMGWFALGKPPQLISPNNDAELGQVQGSPLVFSWQHSSPAVPGAMIQYNFEMWDLRLPEISPYVYVNSMPAMHSSTEHTSPLQIYPAMLNLEPGMKYAWRVTAFDMMNQVPFEQDGKSEVRTFTYLSKCDAPTNLRVEQKGKDAVYTWDADSKHTSYTVEAENVTTGFNNIYTLYDNKKTLKGLDYGNEYRLRVRAVCNNNDMYPSDFSDWKTFRLTPPPTQEEICPECSCEPSNAPPPTITNFELRRDLKEGDTIRRNRTLFIVKTVNQVGDGVYEGQFYAWWRYMGVKFLANYTNLRVNTDNYCLDGLKWKTVRTLGYVADVDAIADALTNDDSNNESDSKNDNGTQDTVQVSFNLPDNPQITYNDSIGTLTITDENGNEQTIELPKDKNGNTEFPVTIVDNNGDTYIVTKDNNGEVKIEKRRDKRNESIEDKSSSMYDKDFLFVTVSGRQDTLMHNHTLNIPKQDIPIKLKINFNRQKLANHAASKYARDETHRGQLRISSNFASHISLESTEWNISTANATGHEFEISPSNMQGSIKLYIDTKDAISPTLYDESIGDDRIIFSEDLDSNKLKLQITINFVEHGLLLFKPINDEYYKSYGFDDALMPELQTGGDEYTPTTISGTNYYVPWLGVVPNQEVTIKTEYIAKDLMSDSIIVLRGYSNDVIFPNNNNKQFTSGDAQFLREFRIKIENEGTHTINAFSIKKGSTTEVLIGKLAIEAKNVATKSEKVRIIRVRRSDESAYPSFDDIKKNNLITKLNEYYRQAFISFELDRDSYRDTLTIRQTLNDNIGNAFVDVYKQYSSSDDTAKIFFHIFICTRNSNNGGVNGFANINFFKTSVLFIPDVEIHNAVAAHEIGHNIGLQHTFENIYDANASMCIVGRKVIPKYATKNIMDYSAGSSDNRSVLFLYQINHLNK